MRRYYYRDPGGKYREIRRGMPAKWAAIALMLLVGLLVLGSLMQSAYQAAKP